MQKPAHHPPARIGRRVILVVCDGLGAEWISPDRTPWLDKLCRSGRTALNHLAVFPSVTRVSAASIATGCYPLRHGLEGNQMGLVENGSVVVHNVGKPAFLNDLRRLTGQTLKVPTLAEYLVPLGGQVAFSNVSAGAAYFLDPDHYGQVFHRLGSFDRGGAMLTGRAHLNVSHDLDGDLQMTERFCREVVTRGTSALGILWLANPDLTTHHHPLGSPEHLHALRQTDMMVGMVCESLQDCDDQEGSLLMIASDHGHESITRSVHIGQWLVSKGLGELLAKGQVAVASQGTSALIYAMPAAQAKLQALLPALLTEPWAGQFHEREALSMLGLPQNDCLWGALDTARDETVNPFGVAGARWLVEDGESDIEIGCGQHGGLGPQEQRPFLSLLHPSLKPETLPQPTSLVDIAPTILDYLGAEPERVDGQSLWTGPRWLD